MSIYLTKSDFKAARECPTKLYYRKMKYPSLSDEDDYLQMLAEGGFIIGKMAQLLYSDGFEITARNPDKAAEETEALLARDRVTLFEPAIRWDNLLVRVDILVKNGNKIELIEVKSKGIDVNEGKGDTPFLNAQDEIIAGWRPYIEDVAFQRLVCSRAHPTWKITPKLMLADKNHATDVDGLASWFRISRTQVEGRPRPQSEAVFNGDVDWIRKHHVLKTYDVSLECGMIDADIAEAADLLAPYLKEGIRTPPAPIGTGCKSCEYRVESKEKNGFRECWGSLADPVPHLFDLYQMGNARANGSRIAPILIDQGKTGLKDVPAGDLTGSYADRQRRQIEQTFSNKEWIDPALGPLLKRLEYPLHFIDFEASRAAVPAHKGMTPYDLIAFQWSCHTIEKPGGPLKHTEWINVENRFPNFEFASSLRSQLGDKGTILTWSPYEKSSLRNIVRQSDRIEGADAAVIEWVDRLVPEGVQNPSRLVDLCELTKKHYYHPEMKGSNSIKYVLPAIWREAHALRKLPEFSPYVREDKGRLLNPYDTLSPLDIAGEAERVAEGTGAIRAYDEMTYGTVAGDPNIKEAWKKLLLEYCKLDTLAMVLIWKYWCTSI